MIKFLVKIVILICAVVIFAVLFFSITDILMAPGYEFEKISKVCVKENCFNVEIANTDAERMYGLMNRKSLDRNSGMFFIFAKEDIYNFWMKNVLIPLDIIWINKNREIVFIEKNIQPCSSDFCTSITPKTKAMYVLEINAGLSDELGLKIGDNFIIDF